MVSVAAIIAVGVNNDGRGKVLRMDIGPPEAEIFWTGFPGKLARSVCVKRVISDAHEGIRQRKGAIVRLVRTTPLEQNEKWAVHRAR